MKRMILFALGALFVGLVSCEKEDIALDATADSFIIVKTVETDEGPEYRYGLALHVFANKPMRTVTAGPENDAAVSYPLEAYGGYAYDFYTQTADDKFSASLPYVGNYLFAVSAQTGETASLSDKLLDELIYPTDSLKAAYDATAQEMKITWNKIDDADYFKVKMFDADEKLVFNGPAIVPGTTKEYKFKSTTSGWASGKSPVNGAQYVIELNAYLYEPGKKDLDLQAKTINFKNVTWGN